MLHLDRKVHSLQAYTLRPGLITWPERTNLLAINPFAAVADEDVALLAGKPLPIESWNQNTTIINSKIST